MKNIKWILISAGLIFFIYAIYTSETSRLEKLGDTQAKKYSSNDSIISYARNDTIENLRIRTNIQTRKKRIYVDEISGDTLDLSRDKFIMILADKYRDKNITYSFSIWYPDMNTCAWSPGVLKMSVYNKNLKLLKTASVSIDKQLGESCMQLDELNIFMGDLIYQATFINAEFTDESGKKYYQTRKRLHDIVDAKPNTDNLANEEKLALKELKRKAKILFTELMSFKDKADFHRYGFAVGYKYNKWLERVKKLKDDPTNKLLLVTDGFVIGDLETLGLEYVSSEGQETEYSTYAEEKIRYGLKEQ